MASLFRRQKRIERSGGDTGGAPPEQDSLVREPAAEEPVREPAAGEATGHGPADPPTSPTRLPTADELAAHDPDPGGTDPLPRTSKHDVDPEQAIDDRQALIRLCMYALDRARSSGVAERIEHGLADIGVVALRPDGERFDPARHEAGGAVPTDDSSLDGRVAETEVVGFADRDQVLRVPIVTVYTANGQS